MEKLEKCPVCESQSFSSYLLTEAQMHPSKAVFNFDQCRDCDLVFLNPRVPEADLKDFYTSWYLPYRGASAWGKYEALVEKSQEKLDIKRADWVRKYHEINQNSTILDVGCGKPTFLQQCKKMYNCTATGIDFSDEGWKGNKTFSDHLELLVGEVKDLPDSLQPDVITMWHYLEHDYQPLENLKILRRHAQPATSLIIEIPNFESQSRKKYGRHWAGYHTPRHTSLFSPKNIRILLESSGWQVVKINTFGTLDPYLLYWMSEMEKKGISWDKNMESELVPFVLGKVKRSPLFWMQKYLSLGIMSVIARPSSDF